VVACDLDGAFLERCRETVAQFGRPERLQTCHVDDGRTLLVADGAADLAFSYITLQHCHPDDAMALTREAVRITRPGGHVALNYRTWTGSDAVLWPIGKLVRASFRIPGIGPSLARQRVTARLGWQANRLAPKPGAAAGGRAPRPTCGSSGRRHGRRSAWPAPTSPRSSVCTRATGGSSARCADSRRPVQLERYFRPSVASGPR
jgi:SAM-dependent methyltransferase